MKRFISIIILLLFQVSVGQDINIIVNIPSNLTADEIINKYLHKIGGEEEMRLTII